MSKINEQIERLRELVRKCYATVAGKNGTVPEVGERNMKNLPDAIGSIIEQDTTLRIVDGCYDSDGNLINVEGLSLVGVLSCAEQMKVTQIIDNSKIDWVFTSAKFPCDRLKQAFPNLEKIVLNCKVLKGRTYEIDYWGDDEHPDYDIEYGEKVEEIQFDNRLFKKYRDTVILYNVKLIQPYQTNIEAGGNIGSPTFSNARVIIAPKLEKICFGTNFKGTFADCEEFIAANLTIISNLYPENAALVSPNAKRLIRFEVGDGFQGYYSWNGYLSQMRKGNIRMSGWSPTIALLVNDLYDSTTTEEGETVEVLVEKANSLVKEGEPFVNNREKFLYNFKHYFADRLADNTDKSRYTLELSQEVRDILTPEIEDIIVTQKNWIISPAKSV